MPIRNIPLVTNEYYHVYNRGVERRPTYLRSSDYQEALSGMSYYRFKQPPQRLSYLKRLNPEIRADILSTLRQEEEILVRIIAFCYMPNHFHLLLQQVAEDGISTFLRRWTNSYTRSFNTKYQRVGPLFQGNFQAVRVESTEQLVHLSRYIHINPVVSAVIRESQLETYRWSSLPEYLSSKIDISEPQLILEQFKSVTEYQSFLRDRISFGKELELIKHLTLE